MISLLNKPLDFVKHINNGKHVVIFYEEAEYAQMIIFKYIENGLLNEEQCFHLSAKDDKDFVKSNLIESISENNDKFVSDIDKYLKNNFLYVGSLPDLYEYPYGLGNAVKDIVNIAKNPVLQSYPTLGVINTQRTKRIALLCMHKIETKEQVQTNIDWEKKYRNILLREALSDCSIVCTYPINDILSTIKGESDLYSEWMANLLEIYDAVVYARGYWKGAAFNLK